LLYVADGRDAGTAAQFADDLEAHNGDASRIKEVCIDMSAAFIKGVTDNLTGAEITFDKFHAVKLVNDALDKVRRAAGILSTKHKPEAPPRIPLPALRGEREARARSALHARRCCAWSSRSSQRGVTPHAA
jgi:transposase